MNEAKPFEIDRRLIYEAYKKVKSNRGSGEIDGVSMEDFDKDLSNNLYRLWNPMSSGSYMPKSVKLVEIPKPNGGKRPLGIPTISDRIAQMAVVLSLIPSLGKLSSKLMMSLTQLASSINPFIRGWVNYYAKFNRTEFRKVTQYLNESLARWMRRKYKGLHHNFGTAFRALAMTAKKQPNLFAHWSYGFRPYLKLVN